MLTGNTGNFKDPCCEDLQTKVKIPNDLTGGRYIYVTWSYQFRKLQIESIVAWQSQI